MSELQKNFVYRNLANITSILGVLPLVLLFLEDGYRFIIPLIIFNNVMDDLDGILAAKLNIRSRFGANIDNVCDAVAHVILVFAVGAHYGEWVLLAGLVAAASIIVRATSRVDPDAVKIGGTPTNELMRHLLFILLIAQIFDLHPGIYLVAVFLLHSISMTVPFKFAITIRGLAKTATLVVLVNVALIAAWLVPVVTPFIAVAFMATYLYSFIAGGLQWLKGSQGKTLA